MYDREPLERVRDDTGYWNREVTRLSLAQPVRLAEGQVAASGAALARAFANDPFFGVLSTPSSGAPHAAAHGGLDAVRPPFGEVYVTAGLVEASAIWLTPGAGRRTEERRPSGVTAVVSVQRRGASALPRDEPAPRRVREAALSVPHRHLPLSVWIPRGRASAWEACYCERASRIDQDGVECRLHRDAAERAAHQRYGFEIAVEGDVPDEGPHLWFMRRRPHPITR
jgi:hypothetical protein